MGNIKMHKLGPKIYKALFVLCILLVVLGIFYKSIGVLQVAIIIGVLATLLQYRISGKMRSLLHSPNRYAPVRQTRSILLHCTYETAIHLCEQSLQTINAQAYKRTDHAQGKILATTKMSGRSWGERISYSIRRYDNDAMCITIESHPRLITVIIDLGKSFDNVESILTFLKEQCAYSEMNRTSIPP